MSGGRSQFVTLCGRVFRDTDARYFPQASHGGRTIYLCTQVCLEAFRADPQKFFRAHRNTEKHKGSIEPGVARDVA